MANFDDVQEVFLNQDPWMISNSATITFVVTPSSEPPVVYLPIVRW